MKNEAIIHIHHKRIPFAVQEKWSFFMENKTIHTVLRALKYLQIDLCCACFFHETWVVLLCDVKSWLRLGSLGAETELGILT